jgi:hypothetical protein
MGALKGQKDIRQSSQGIKKLKMQKLGRGECLIDENLDRTTYVRQEECSVPVGLLLPKDRRHKSVSEQKLAGQTC